MVRARVLIVEDELTIAKDIQTQLKRMGYDVVDDAVRSGEDAIYKVQETQPAVVLMDIRLQGKIDGIEAAEQIRERFKIPVIYLTAYSDENTLRRAKTTEPFGYLLKPFTSKQLQAIIEMAIYKSQMEHQLREREEALRLSEEKYRTLFELASDVFLTVWPDGKILDANMAAVQILGYSKAEFRELSGQQIIAPEVFEETNQEWQTQVERKGHFLLETVWVRKDGSRFPVAVSGKPLELDDEILFQLIGRDITDRKEAEIALKRSEENLKKAQQTAHLGSYEWNLETESITWSDEMYRIYGVSPERFGKTLTLEEIMKLTHRDDIPRIAKNIKRLLEGGTRGPSEYRVIHPDGSERTLWGEGEVVVDESHKPIRMVGTVLDITERAQAEERERLHQRQLIQADKMASLGLMVSGIAHEINNPNYSISLNAKLISRAWNDAMPILDKYYEENAEFVLAGMPYTQGRKKITPLISGISEGAKRIQRIVQSLKAFARQDKGDLDQKVDVNSVVESATTLIDNLIRQSTRHFSVTYERNLPIIRGNMQQIEQVLINLITNSCQALENKEQQITISTWYDKDSNHVIIAVGDEGTGIPPENLNHIMEPFFSTKRERGGTGLGLSVSYNLIKNHGGKLDFTSKPGEGTTAMIILPVDYLKSVPSR